MLKWNKQLLIDYRNTFESETGKRVLDDLRKNSSIVTEGIKYRNGVDVNRLLVQEGEANVIKYIYKMLGRDPNEEAVKRARTERRAINESV